MVECLLRRSASVVSSRSVLPFDVLCSISDFSAVSVDILSATAFLVTSSSLFRPSFSPTINGLPAIGDFSLLVSRVHFLTFGTKQALVGGPGEVYRSRKPNPCGLPEVIGTSSGSQQRLKRRFGGAVHESEA